MAATDFTNLAAAKAVVEAIIPNMDDGELEAMLVASAADVSSTDTTTVYRPYVVAAFFIRTRWQQYKRLKSAAGSEIEYASAGIAFRTLSDLQARYDADLYDVPAAWAATTGQTFRPVF